MQLHLLKRRLAARSRLPRAMLRAYTFARAAPLLIASNKPVELLDETDLFVEAHLQGHHGRESASRSVVESCWAVVAYLHARVRPNPDLSTLPCFPSPKARLMTDSGTATVIPASVAPTSSDLPPLIFASHPKLQLNLHDVKPVAARCCSLLARLRLHLLRAHASPGSLTAQSPVWRLPSRPSVKMAFHSGAVRHARRDCLSPLVSS